MSHWTEATPSFPLAATLDLLAFDGCASNQPLFRELSAHRHCTVLGTSTYSGMFIDE